MKELKVFKEFWRTVVINGVKYPKYEVSNFGNVKCLDYRGTGKERMCKLTKDWYGYATVSINGTSKKVHRLVAEAFIPNSYNKPFIDHIFTTISENIVLLADDGKTILYSTIKWATPSENQNNKMSIKNHTTNASKHLLGKKGCEHYRSIPIVQLSLDGQFIREWSCALEVERSLKIHNTTINSCCRGREHYKSAGGFKWMYLSDWLKVCKHKHEDIKPLF